MRKIFYILLGFLFLMSLFQLPVYAQEACNITVNAGATQMSDGKFRVNTLINTASLLTGKDYRLEGYISGRLGSDLFTFSPSGQGEIIQRSFDLDSLGASEITLAVERIGGIGIKHFQASVCQTKVALLKEAAKNTNENLPSLPKSNVSEGNIKCKDNPNGINTAIGCIPIDSENGLIGFFLRWGVGIGGGIAFLLILWAGFMIMTSTGDPKRLQAGQELLTSAIGGLILLIFSVFILRVIGVDILGIPGFSTRPPAAVQQQDKR